MNAEKTGKLIRELRTEKKLTQQELAAVLKVSPTAISKWENGRALPDISMLEPLVKVFDVTFAEIILGERAAHKAAETETAMSGAEKAEAADQTQAASAANMSVEDKTEAAIKSVIDESITQKERSARTGTVVMAVIMLILAAAFIVAMLTGTGSSKYRPTLDLTGLENISSLPMDGAFAQGGKQYLPYRHVYGSGFDSLMKKLNLSSPDQMGRVVAYRFTPNGSACYYYCTVDALPGDWLLMFQDDRSGVPGANNAIDLFGTQESIDQVSGWLLAGDLSSIEVMPEGARYDITKSANRYTAVYDWEAKPAEHLYAYTAEMPREVQAAVIKQLNGQGKPGALLPVHFPENAMWFGTEDYTRSFFCLIEKNQAGNITVVIAEIGAKTGELRVSGDYEGVDWAGIAGYTSPEEPMYLYFEGYQFYAVIGDTAYCLTWRNSPSMEKTDSFVPCPGGSVEDVMNHETGQNGRK